VEVIRILAVDPGMTTGVALWDSRRPSDVHVIEMSDDDFLDWVWAYQSSFDLVVCEAFRLGSRTTGKTVEGSMRTIELIGALRFVARLKDFPLVLQQPAEAEGFSTKEKLQRVGWWTQGKEHGRSATKHLLLYLVVSGRIPAESVVG
jgi:hypothetical protein